MSKKKNRLGSSEEILSNIGNRMSSQKSKNKEEETSTNNKDEKNNDKTKETSTSNEEKKSSAVNKSWFDEQKPYRSSFIVKPDMEDNFETCKKKFRKELRMNLSKQNAIELGWLLLKKLDENYFNEVKKVSSPDDDLVESLKKIINKLS